MIVTSPLNVSKKYFENLDGLRFVLALIVFFSHSQLGEAIIQIVQSDFIGRLIQVFSSGPLAVSFFFTLSGYLITYLIIEEKENTGNFSIKNFYLRRVLRIWPLYYIVLVFAFFIYPSIKVWLGYPDQNPFHFLYQALFLANFDSIFVHRHGLVGVAPMMININWSIAIEEQFYLFWPILFLISGARKFWLVILLTIISSLLCRTYLFDGPQQYYHTLSCASDLAVGALLAFLSFYSKSFVANIERMPRALIAVIYVGGICFLMYRDLLYISDRIMISVFFAFIILDQNFAKASFYKFGTSKFLSSLGKYSYSLYLLHPIGIQVSILSFRFLNLNRNDGFGYASLYTVIAFLVAMFLSVLSYQYMELFFLNLRKRYYSLKS